MALEDSLDDEYDSEESDHDHRKAPPRIKSANWHKHKRARIRGRARLRFIRRGHQLYKRRCHHPRVILQRNENRVNQRRPMIMSKLLDANRADHTVPQKSIENIVEEKSAVQERVDFDARSIQFLSDREQQ